MSSTSANAATVTVSSVQVGDLIVVVARTVMSTTPPSLPAGWTSLGTDWNGAPSAIRLGYKVAAKILSEAMPQTPKGRSGDLGEILATELVEEERRRPGRP